MQKRALRTPAVGLLTAALASGLWTPTRLEAGSAPKSRRHPHRQRKSFRRRRSTNWRPSPRRSAPRA